MGVPKFYRWISERYPCLSEVLKDYQIPEFDNLYLDMNGIVHVCSHPEDDNPHFRITEEKIVTDIFHYIEVLFRMIKPKKVFFMAVDGVAPRAKMNQQRGRRFRSAREAEDLVRKALEKGEILPTEARFDSNCITPGTEFMVRLHEKLKYFVAMKVSTDRLWHGVRVILSGHETPGEGEHKIMDFIRTEKSESGYDPNTRHCLYGLDADLIMLGLITHEPHFSLLREEVRFGGKKSAQKRSNAPEETTFHLLHLSVLREYLDFEFSTLRDKLPFPYSVERIIDDWVLMGFLVGNDFIPHLPHMHIHHECLPKLWKYYERVLPTLDGYLNDGGELVLRRFEIFMETVAKCDIEYFSEAYSDIKWMESKRASGKGGPPKDGARAVTYPSTDIRRKREKKASLSSEDAGIPSAENFMVLKDIEDEIDFTALSLGNDDGDDDDEDDGSLEMAEALEKDDKFMTEFVAYKHNYYKEKMGFREVNKEVLKELSHGYIRAIQWILYYYYNGVPSWSWFYPLHYAPYISDVHSFSQMDLSFDYAKPFLPFEQLMAVLPAASKNLLPKPYQLLMTSSNSSIIDFYPVEFEHDLNGKQQPWEAVVLIPFIEEARLLSAMASVEDQLLPEEKARNVHGPHVLGIYSPELQTEFPAPYPSLPNLVHNHAKITLLPITAFVTEARLLKKGLCEGVRLDVYFPGFPTLKHFPHTAKFTAMGVKVFQMNSRGDNCILELEPKESPDIEKVASELLGRSVYADWPHLQEVFVISLTSEEYRYTLSQDPQLRSQKKLKPVYEALTNDEMSKWRKEVHNLQDWYMNRRGVEVGGTDILVTARPLIGRKYVCGPQGKITLDKQWAKNSVSFLYQTCIKDISVRDPTFTQYSSMNELYAPGTDVFMLGNPHYGSKGKVLSVDQDGRIIINFISLMEPNMESIKNQHSHVRHRYMRGYEAASRCGISPYLLSRITGTIFISKGKDGRNSRRTNIGLNLKFNKTCKQVPGYTMKDDTEWKYSPKLVDTIRIYIEKFPDLFDFLGTASNEDSYSEEEVFPSEEPTLKQVTEFIKSLPCSEMPPMPHGAQLLDGEVVAAIEKTVNNVQEQNSKKKKHVKMQVRPHLLYRPVDGLANIVPDPSSTYELFDRVVNVRDGYSVPLGLRGTVIALLPAAKEQDTLYEVVFDEPFLGGLTLRSSVGRAYKMPPTSLINLSHGQQKDQAKNPDKPAAIVKPQTTEASLKTGQSSYSSLLVGNKDRSRGFDNYTQDSSSRFRGGQRFPNSSGQRAQFPHQTNMYGRPPAQTSAQVYLGPGQKPPRQPQMNGPGQYETFWSNLGPGMPNQAGRGHSAPPRQRSAGGHGERGQPHPQNHGSGQPRNQGPSLMQAAQALPQNLTMKSNRGGHDMNSKDGPPEKKAHREGSAPASGAPQKIDLQHLFNAADGNKPNQPVNQSQSEFEAMFSALSVAMDSSDNQSVSTSNTDAILSGASAPATAQDGSAALCQMLNIGTKTKDTDDVKSKATPTYGKQVSVQELFQGAQSATADAKKTEIQTPSSKVEELEAWCQQQNLALPCYEYQKREDKLRAVVTLTSGAQFKGSYSKSNTNAAESAAAIALMSLKAPKIPLSIGDPVLSTSPLSAFTPVKQGPIDGSQSHLQQLPPAFFNVGIPPPAHGFNHRQHFPRQHQHQFPPPGFHLRGPPPPRQIWTGPSHPQHPQNHKSQGHESSGAGQEGQNRTGRDEVTPKKSKGDAGKQTETTPSKSPHSAFIPTQVLRKQKTPRKDSKSESPVAGAPPIGAVKTSPPSSKPQAPPTSHTPLTAKPPAEKSIGNITVEQTTNAKQLNQSANAIKPSSFVMSDGNMKHASTSQQPKKSADESVVEDATGATSALTPNSKQRKAKSRLAANFPGV